VKDKYLRESGEMHSRTKKSAEISVEGEKGEVKFPSNSQPIHQHHLNLCNDFHIKSENIFIAEFESKAEGRKIASHFNERHFSVD
jgi:hypothetical protein